MHIRHYRNSCLSSFVLYKIQWSTELFSLSCMSDNLPIKAWNIFSAEAMHHPQRGRLAESKPPSIPIYCLALKLHAFGVKFMPKIGNIFNFPPYFLHEMGVFQLLGPAIHNISVWIIVPCWKVQMSPHKILRERTAVLWSLLNVVTWILFVYFIALQWYNSIRPGAWRFKPISPCNWQDILSSK